MSTVCYAVGIRFIDGSGLYYVRKITKTLGAAIRTKHAISSNLTLRGVADVCSVVIREIPVSSVKVFGARMRTMRRIRRQSPLRWGWKDTALMEEDWLVDEPPLHLAFESLEPPAEFLGEEWRTES